MRKWIILGLVSILYTSWADEPISNSWDESTSAISVVAMGRSSEVISKQDPFESGSPRKWRQQTFLIKNSSKTSFYVYGQTLRNVFVRVYTKNPKNQTWEDREIGYCGTGAGLSEVRPRMVFAVTVYLPVEMAEREFRIEFERFASQSDNTGVIERTKPLRMN